MKTIEHFQTVGFEANLYFLLVSSTELCKQRVQQRVDEGGHNVNQVVVEERFEKGLKLLDASFFVFERVFLFNASHTFSTSLIAAFQHGEEAINYSGAIPAEIVSKLSKIRTRISV